MLCYRLNALIFIIIVIISQLNINECQIVTPPPNRVFYEQWGHYHNYDPRNRPLESDRRPPYEGYNYGVTPDPTRRRLIEDPGDLRCKEAVHQGLEEFVTVSTLYGNVVGRIVYLCDGPGKPLRDRPLPAQYQVSGSPTGYHTIRSFWKNVTTFLGIPYARPPIREYNLRFKVRMTSIAFIYIPNLRLFK